VARIARELSSRTLNLETRPFDVGVLRDVGLDATFVVRNTAERPETLHRPAVAIAITEASMRTITLTPPFQNLRLVAALEEPVDILPGHHEPSYTRREHGLGWTPSILPVLHSFVRQNARERRADPDNGGFEWE
jgi:hypothetical protein